MFVLHFLNFLQEQSVNQLSIIIYHSSVAQRVSFATRNIRYR